MPSQSREERSIAQAAAQIAAVGETIEVLAVTTDPGLLATLRQAVGSHHRVWHAADREQAIELIMAGRVGVIVIDTIATGVESAAFCEQLRAQFPDLVLIVAGGADDQTHLIKQITAGDIYRFLHKPVSTPRARQFIDTAIRRHLEGRTFTPLETAPAPRALKVKVWIAIAAALLVAIAVAATVFVFSGDDSGVASRVTPPPSAEQSLEPVADAVETPVPARPPPVEATAPSAPQAAVSAPVPVAAAPSAGSEIVALLARAETALAKGELVTPKGASAFDLYSAVLARDAVNRGAHDGLDRIADQLLSNAENAMLEERVDDAARDIEAARSVRPNNVRLAFLSAQLSKERERRYVALAREAAAKGNPDRARTLMERAAQEQAAPSAVVAGARKELDMARREDSVENLLVRANARLKQDRLVAPANDSARSYIEAALAADPNSVPAQQAKRALADQLLARARQATSGRDIAAATAWLAHAEAMGADRAALRTAQRNLLNLRQATARAVEVNRLTGLLNERIQQNRFIEPAGDNAKAYWQGLRTLDASNAVLQPALQAIGLGLVRQSRQSLQDRKLDDAARALTEARDLGYTSSELGALDAEIVAARERASFMADIVQAGQVAREKEIAPRYPTSAQRKGIEGWVDLEFTIAADGTVKELAVRAAQPNGVFEEAARRAVTQWIYRPVMRNGQAVNQRARLRVRFDLTEEE
jgi:TonB family protein